MIEIFMVLIDKSYFINPIEGQLFRLTFCLFAFKLVFTKYTVKEWLVILLFGILGFVSYYVTGRNEILRIVVFIASCKDVDMKQCIKSVFWVTLSGCVVIILLSLFGILGDIALTAEYRKGVIETRYVFGMGHPNALHCMLWAVMTLAIYLYGERMKLWHYMILFIGNIGLYLLTNSRTGMMIGVFTILFALLLKYTGKSKINKGNLCFSYIMVGTSVIFSVLSAIYSIYVRAYRWGWVDKESTVHRIWFKIDQAMTCRIYNLTDTVNQEGSIGSWSLFSNPSRDYYFDMGWVRLFYWYGIIPAIVFIIVLLLLIWRMYQHRDLMGICMVTVFSIYSIAEAHFISVYIGRNYVFLLLGMYWCDMILKKREEKSSYFWELPKQLLHARSET